MRILDLLDEACIDLNACPTNKDEAIDMAVALMERCGAISNTKKYRDLVLKRENECSTGIGGGIAIPHGKGSVVLRPALAALVIKNGVDFDAVDEAPIHLLFMIAAPVQEDNIHLDVIGRLSKLLIDESFVEKLKNADSPRTFLDVIKQADVDRIKEVDCVCEPKRILAVTACPTGIAHTYMAAESLEKAAKQLDCKIKVETRGLSGTKNKLTKEEIEAADGIIVAADTKVPLERFKGKRLIQCSVSDGIYKAEHIIETIKQDRAAVYQPASIQMVLPVNTGSVKGRQFYVHLMNGISHMLPFVVGGGILIALAFLIDGLLVDMTAEDVGALMGTITPAAALLKKIGDIAFGLMLPVLSGYIAMSISDRAGLCAGFVGGVLASTGKSGFLGALVVGFLAGYVVFAMKKCVEKLPQWFEKISTVLLFPLFGTLIVGLIMLYAIEPTVGVINTGLASLLNTMSQHSKIILGCVVAAMMAVDMGGPFNKTAYVFGTAAIALGNYSIMAAVMIGGMVPPCAIALATLVFKKKFTKQERRLGASTLIMGLAFITEGAIPYVASDPIPVIISCVSGSAVAGALSMLFGCTLMAPHGGIFVIPIMGNSVGFLIALAAGALVGAIILGILKKEKRYV